MTKEQLEVTNIAKKFGEKATNTIVQFTDFGAKIFSLINLANSLREEFITQCNGCKTEQPRNPSEAWYKQAAKEVEISETVEKVYIKEIAKRCKSLGLHFYIQTDPRGGTLYVSKEKLNDQNYHNGIFIA